MTAAFEELERGVHAAQLVAHRKVVMESSGIDYLAFSAHKAYAPFGTGALLARKGLLNFSPAEEDVDTLVHVLGGIARQPKGGSPEKNVQQLMDEFSETAAQRVYC